MLARNAGMSSDSICTNTFDLLSCEIFVLTSKSDAEEEREPEGFNAKLIDLAIRLDLERVNLCLLNEICILALQFLSVNTVCSTCHLVITFSAIPDPCSNSTKFQ
jgi:hypothetical protein